MGLISSAYRWLTNAGDGAAANMQSKIGGGAGYSFWRISDDSSATQVNDGESAVWTGSNGIGTSLTSRRMTINGGAWATAGSGSLLRSTATGVVSKLDQGTDNYVLTVDTAVEGGMAWELPQSSPLVNTYVGYGSAGNVLTGEMVFNYNAGLNTMSVPTGSATVWTATTITDGTATMSGDIVTAGTITDGTATLTGGDLSVVDVTTQGAHINTITEVITLPPAPTYDMTPDDYHVHITNGGDPATGAGLAQPITLPAIQVGRVVFLSTSGSTPTHSGINTITLSASGSDTINTLLTSTVLSNNGNNNYDIFKFVAESATNWVGAKMEAVS